MNRLSFALAAALLLQVGGDERLARHRNLGKAFYENPTTQVQAVEEFRKALELAPGSSRERLNYGLALLRAGKTAEGIAELEKVQKQDPSIPHTWFNLGIAYKRAGQLQRAIQQFERMIELVPDEPVSHYNLGALHRALKQPEPAVKYFEAALKLDPNLAAPRFQLFSLYRQLRRNEDSARMLEEFQVVKKRQEGAAIPEDMEWSYYAEVLERIEPRKGETPAVKVAFRARTTEEGADGVAVTDTDGDGRPELVVWSESRVAVDGQELEAATGVIGVAPGDANNDGRVDLCVLTGGGPLLYVDRKRAALPAKGRFERAVWLDYDHDYDLDLFLLGAKSVLLRNDGTARFEDRTAEFPFVEGHAIDGAAFRLVADSKGMDLAVSYAGRPGVLYRDRLAGKYDAEPLKEVPDGARHLAAYDFDNDSEMDLLFSSERGIILALNRRGRFETVPLSSASGAFALADLENRGFADLVTSAGVLRNVGLGRVGDAEPQAFEAATAFAASDFNGDGRIDVAAAHGGRLSVLTNATESGNQWIRVGITGIKNLKKAAGAEIEVKAGTIYQKKMYEGVPLLFGLAGEKVVEAVRITWPNGLIQNETQQAARRAVSYEEAQRLSGSCPMIFTWDGERFRFITDVLGVAPLGASAGDGKYFPVDHDEYVQIPGDALALRDGRYEIRVTEELREVSYIDQVRLIALDHPESIEVFTNDKFKSPPFPEFRLFGVKRRVLPVRARDHRGRDVVAAVLKRDRVYPAGFRRDYGGIAETHSIELDFGRAAGPGRAVLLLNGWVDWADGSTFRAASQRGGVIMPYLEVKGGTTIEDMGIPAGKPKTIAVEVAFPTAEREVRIVTNLCVYWDEVFLSEETGAPPARLTQVATETAGLRFRGFSRPIIHPRRTQPEAFDYAHVSPVSMWNPTPGMYTRYGEVRELLETPDDRFVVMGSGDEMVLRFDPANLPPLAPGWRRDFLLLFDGWAKDGDLNTAWSQTVEPLPFHGMAEYGEPYPGELTRTRPALRLIRPLR